MALKRGKIYRAVFLPDSGHREETHLECNRRCLDKSKFGRAMPPLSFLSSVCAYSATEEMLTRSSLSCCCVVIVVIVIETACLSAKNNIATMKQYLRE